MIGLDVSGSMVAPITGMPLSCPMLRESGQVEGQRLPGGELIVILPSQAERLPAAPDRPPPHDASEVERVVVLYYGRDGSRAGFEFTGVRKVVLETRRDVDTAPYGDYSLPPRITGEEHELTITASQRRGLVYSPDAPWPR